VEIAQQDGMNRATLYRDHNYNNEHQYAIFFSESWVEKLEKDLSQIVKPFQLKVYRQDVLPMVDIMVVIRWGNAVEKPCTVQ
jgi:hypothetical protein